MGLAKKSELGLFQKTPKMSIFGHLLIVYFEVSEHNYEHFLDLLDELNNAG